MKKGQLNSYPINNKVHLTGYTSTSTDFEIAKKFALYNLGADEIPVIFSINFKGSQGLFQMSKEYTAYPEENEILVQDGLEYLITN